MRTRVGLIAMHVRASEWERGRSAQNWNIAKHPGLTILCDHAGVLEQSHFKLRVVSDKFEGVPLVKRHQ